MSKEAFSAARSSSDQLAMADPPFTDALIDVDMDTLEDLGIGRLAILQALQSHETDEPYTPDTNLVLYNGERRRGSMVGINSSIQQTHLEYDGPSGFSR